MPYFFNYHKEKLKRKIRKINNLNILLCCVLQLITLISSNEIARIFGFKLLDTKFFNFFSKKKTVIFISYTIFICFFLFLGLIGIFFKGKNGFEIINFLFSFIIIFELCMRIGKSKKYSDWIGYELDESLRIFIMFIISLNIIYFLNRITHNILQIQ